ncbi:MAG: SigB/SigF/SigG family RNA polymerase sigma factor [Clostridium sp.]|nr:SigB/SigF/SigG family RNA polymerase sigma factor [Clostridium sp.]
MEGAERQDRTIHLITLAHQGDKEARDALVEENVGLIWSIVRRFAGRGCETEDLFQIGSIGLMKAIDNFDTSFDVKFSTYAVPLIMGEIKRFLRDDGMIKVSRSIKEMGIRVSASRQKLSGSLGREPTLEELAEDVGASREEVAVSLEAGAQVESLYAPMPGGEDTSLSLLERLSDENRENEEALDRVILRELLGSLEKRERELIVRRYFYDQTQTKIADIMGISQVQVSRMEKKILKKMRESFE